jgi:aminoglycoside phosphotransferase (APT) family kinase protein
MLEEANSEFGWLFLEDAGIQEYSKLNGEHRELIAQWLALMHTSARHISEPASLPDKGPNHYLERLVFTCDALLDLLPNLTVQHDDLTPVETIVSQFDLLESHWDQVEKFCAGIPRTLVHGDFVTKNLRIRSSQAGMVLLPFDWGEAGWGIPAVDIMQVDVASYWSTVHGHWPWLDVHAIQRLATVGKIFRCIDAVYWELPSFKYAWSKDPFYNMNIYASRLADAMRAAGLSSAARTQE